jgi:hypothetical protein
VLPLQIAGLDTTARWISAPHMSVRIDSSLVFASAVFRYVPLATVALF